MSKENEEEYLLSSLSSHHKIKPPSSLWRKNCCPCIPKRYILAVLSFLGFCNVYAMRVNLSMAIIVMTNDSSHATSGFSSHRTFNWTADEQGWILSAFFIGYILTQIPGGWIASRFGAKHVFGIGIVMTAVFTLLTPVAADLSIYVLIVIRVLEGIFEGVTFPSNLSLWGKWAPPSERGRLLTLTFAGQYVGNVLSFPLTALLCKYGFDGGWPSAFYIFGIFGLIWFVFWLLLAFNSPSTHPRISKSEKKYIEHSIAEANSHTVLKVPTPWFQIFTSTAVWAIIVAQFCGNFGFYILLTTMPTYFKQALDFDLKKDLIMNGVYSAIPYVLQTLVVLTIGPVADLIRAKLLSTTNTRKLFTCSSSVLSAMFLLLCAYCGSTKTTALLLLTLGVGSGGLSLAGHTVNMVDIAPRFSGVIMGIANTVGTVPGIIGPIIAKHIANASESEKELLIEEWRNVFIIAAEVYIFGAAIYAILADANKQPWAEGSSKKVPAASSQC